MSRGWIKLHRKIRDNALWQDKPFSKGQAWIDLLLEVNHENKKILFNNQILEIKRGETITSIRKLSERWGWSRAKVSRFLKWLADEKMLTKNSDSKKTALKVLNYNDYQESQDSKKATKKTVKSHQKDSDAHKQECKELKNDKNKDIYIPYQKIKKLYNIICISLKPIRNISENRKRHIKARWFEIKEGQLTVFEKLFKMTEDSDFLTGRVKSKGKYKNFKADFDWLIKNDNNFNKVLEGKYENQEDKQMEAEEYYAKGYR